MKLKKLDNINHDFKINIINKIKIDDYRGINLILIN